MAYEWLADMPVYECLTRGWTDEQVRRICKEFVKKEEKAMKPTRAIYDDPATVVYWSDGTKTVVVCQEGDCYDAREGFLLCCAKRLMGNTGAYNDAMREHCPGFHADSELVGEIADAINRVHPPKEEMTIIPHGRDLMTVVTSALVGKGV